MKPNNIGARKRRTYYLTVMMASVFVIAGQSSLTADAADANVHYMTDEERTQHFDAVKKRESEKIDSKVHFMSDHERRALTGVILYKVPTGVDPIYSDERMRPSIYKVPDGADPVYPDDETESDAANVVPTGDGPVYKIPDAADPIEVAVEDNTPDVTTIEGCQIAIKDKLGSNPITFQSGSTKVGADSLDTINSIVELLEGCTDANVVVEGHTDSSGSASQNQQLSGKRASAVADLLEKGGIGKKRLRAVGYGSSKPIVENDTDENKARNRRIELTLY